MSIGWWAYSGAWQGPDIPNDFKRLPFLGVVCNASLSGLGATVLTMGEEDILDGAAVRKLRCMMRGVASWRGP
eukprot:7106165-Pyramimonas_sp.AAC.1